MKVKCVLAIGILAMAVLLSGVAAADGVASVSTDKKEYHEGENVSITVTNNCRGPLAFNGYWVENEKGERVYSSRITAYPVMMGPGESHIDVWSQNSDDGGAVGPGAYFIKIEQDTITVTILRSAEDVSTDKQTYDPGESKAYVWEQTDDNGNDVLPGVYTVHVNGDSAELTIKEPAAKAHKSTRPAMTGPANREVGDVLPIWRLHGKVI